VSAEDIRLTLNRSAIVVKPKQPFLDWLHAADSTSSDLTLQELVLEPAIYLIPECDTPEEVAAVLHELCEEIFVERSRREGVEQGHRRYPSDLKA